MSVNSNKKILDASKLSLILSRLASQIFENHLDFSDVVLIGIQPRGKILSQKICNLLNEKFDVGEIKLGFLDITFFRDDFSDIVWPEPSAFKFILAGVLCLDIYG